MTNGKPSARSAEPSSAAPLPAATGEHASEESELESTMPQDMQHAITQLLSANLSKLRRGQRAAVLLIGVAVLALVSIAGGVIAQYAAVDGTPVVLVVIVVLALIVAVGLLQLDRTHAPKAITKVVESSVAETAAELRRKRTVWNQPLLDVDGCREAVLAALQEIHRAVSSNLRTRWKVGDERNVRVFAFFATRGGGFQDPAWLVLSHFGCHVGTDLSPSDKDANLRIPFRDGVVGAAFCRPTGTQSGTRAFGLGSTVLPFVRDDLQFVCAKAFKRERDVLCVVGLDFAGLKETDERIAQIAEAEAALAWSFVMPEVRPELQQALVAAVAKRIVVTEESA